MRFSSLSIWTLLLCSWVFTASVYAHEEDVNEYSCHDLEVGEDEDPMCHCHLPHDFENPQSCTEGKPDEPIMSIYGLKVEPEDECTDYESSDYTYARYLDRVKANEMGGYYAAYENICYEGERDVTIEHLVARHQAHVSGMCDEPIQVKVDFANDMENIALALYEVNSAKSNSDPAEWLPDHHVCWFVAQHVRVKQDWNLTIDLEELKATREILEECNFHDTFLVVPSDCTIEEDEESIEFEHEDEWLH